MIPLQCQFFFCIFVLFRAQCVGGCQICPSIAFRWAALRSFGYHLSSFTFFSYNGLHLHYYNDQTSRMAHFCVDPVRVGVLGKEFLRIKT